MSPYLFIGLWGLAIAAPVVLAGFAERHWRDKL